jgi:hypothetical protein
MNGAAATRAPWRWQLPLAVFAVVAVCQLLLIAGAGTDIPFQDQWDIEGARLYPHWLAGDWRWADLIRPYNEHRIFWTHLWNLTWFSLNGQWDPLVQQAANTLLRAGVASAVAVVFAGGVAGRRRWAAAAIVAVAFLPHLAWHHVLWGFESQLAFVLGFSLLAVGLLEPAQRSAGRTALGLAAGLAAQFAMGPGALVPVVLLGLAGLRAVEARRVGSSTWKWAWPAGMLGLLAWGLRRADPELAALAAPDGLTFLRSAGQVLAWPYFGSPLAGVAMNLPLLGLLVLRVSRRRTPVKGEDRILGAGGWSIAVALAVAWARGGSDELAGGVPSRYADFLVLLPLANAWCAVQLAREAGPRFRASVGLVAVAWGLCLGVAWLGLSAQMMRGIVLPRLRDRDAPVRLARAFQLTGNPAVFAGQPRLLVPHPNPESVRTVLHDARLSGRLPPSLQPDQPMGPLSRAVRGLLAR